MFSPSFFPENTKPIQLCQAADEDWEKISHNSYSSYNGDSVTTKASLDLDSEVSDQDKTRTTPEINQKLVPLPCSMSKFKEQIAQKAAELDVCYQLGVENIIVSGDETGILIFEQFIVDLSQNEAGKSPVKTKIIEEEREQQQRDYELGAFIQKTLRLHTSVKTNIEAVQGKAKELQLVCDTLDDKISITGPQKFVLEFISWMYDFTLDCVDNEGLKLKEIQVNDFSQSEVGISTFHRMQKNEIVQKAQEMNLACEFNYDVVVVSGRCETVKEFKSYLHELEASTKKSLYPKFWQFYDFTPYSEIQVENTSEEFEMVSGLFQETMKEFNITKLVRIQNRYIMDHYITMVQKRRELRQDTQFNRKLLFHGTRHAAPQLIYRNFDTGFDTQYANYGAYGRGLYFARDANYSHNGFSHQVSENKWQMLLTDVLVGKSFKSQPNGRFIKAPEGFDSVEADEVSPFYVIYNNFHSVPLYLIEYEANQ